MADNPTQTEHVESDVNDPQVIVAGYDDLTAITSFDSTETQDVGNESNQTVQNVQPDQGIKVPDGDGSEIQKLRQQLADKDRHISSLEGQIQGIEKTMTLHPPEEAKVDEEEKVTALSFTDEEMALLSERMEKDPAGTTVQLLQMAGEVQTKQILKKIEDLQAPAREEQKLQQERQVLESALRREMQTALNTYGDAAKPVLAQMIQDPNNSPLVAEIRSIGDTVLQAPGYLAMLVGKYITSEQDGSGTSQDQIQSQSDGTIRAGARSQDLSGTKEQITPEESIRRSVLTASGKEDKLREMFNY